MENDRLKLLAEIQKESPDLLDRWISEDKPLFHMSADEIRREWECDRVAN